MQITAYLDAIHVRLDAMEDVKAHHYIISFSPGDPITMEQALEFGKNWLKEFAPGHQAAVQIVHVVMYNRF